MSLSILSHTDTLPSTEPSGSLPPVKHHVRRRVPALVHRLGEVAGGAIGADLDAVDDVVVAAEPVGRVPRRVVLDIAVVVAAVDAVPDVDRHGVAVVAHAAGEVAVVGRRHVRVRLGAVARQVEVADREAHLGVDLAGARRRGQREPAAAAAAAVVEAVEAEGEAVGEAGKLCPPCAAGLVARLADKLGEVFRGLMVDKQGVKVGGAVYAGKVEDPDVARLEQADLLATTSVVAARDEHLQAAEVLIHNGGAGR